MQSGDKPRQCVFSGPEKMLWGLRAREHSWLKASGKNLWSKWSIEANVLYQVELEVEKRRDLGKSNISRKENIYRSVEAKVYEMY